MALCIPVLSPMDLPEPSPSSWSGMSSAPDLSAKKVKPPSALYLSGLETVFINTFCPIAQSLYMMISPDTVHTGKFTFLLTHRETDNKTGANLRTGYNLDRARVSIDDPFGYGKSKPGSAGLAVSRFIRPVKPLKDMNDI